MAKPSGGPITRFFGQPSKTASISPPVRNYSAFENSERVAYRLLIWHNRSI